MDIHSINISIHVLAGTLGILAGIIALLNNRKHRIHSRWGRIFLYLLSVVVVSGFLGWLFYRSNPFLLMLTILSGYVGFAGWRIIKLKSNKATIVDITAGVSALSLGLVYIFYLKSSNGNWNPAVIYSTVGALLLVTSYDIIKYLFLFKYLCHWWLYEHISKMISAFSALLSAFVGTVLPNFKPYSQIAPSSLGIMLIILLIWREAKRKKHKQYRTWSRRE